MTSPLTPRTDVTEGSPRKDTPGSWPLADGTDGLPSSAVSSPGKEEAAEPDWLREASNMLNMDSSRDDDAATHHGQVDGADGMGADDASATADEDETAPAPPLGHRPKMEAPQPPSIAALLAHQQHQDQHHQHHQHHQHAAGDDNADAPTAEQRGALADQALFFGASARAPAAPPASPTPSSPTTTVTCSESAASTVPALAMPPPHMSAKAWGKMPVQAVQTTAAATHAAAMRHPPRPTTSAFCSAAAPIAPPPAITVPAAGSGCAHPLPGAQQSSPLQQNFGALTPVQRGALIDQATFFGMDLRIAGQAVLCGGATGAGGPSIAAPSLVASTPPPEAATVTYAAAAAAATSAKGMARRMAAPALAAMMEEDDETPLPAKRSLPRVVAGDAAAADPMGAGGAEGWAAEGLRLRAAACYEADAASSAAADFDASEPNEWAGASSAAVMDAAHWSRVAKRAWHTLTMRHGVASRAVALAYRKSIRLSGLIDHVAVRIYDAIAGVADRASELAMRYTLAVAAVLVSTLAGIGAAGARRVIGAAAPPLASANAHARRALHSLRKHRTGRHVSNGVGALASLALTRAVVVVGPLVGAMLYAPLEASFFAMGLQDIRFLVPAAAVLIGMLLRLYSHLGWLD